jgi:hypothetical protein
MDKINVIDLDCTLLPYDSFGKLVKTELKGLKLYVLLVSALRILRIISNLQFKQLLTKYWSNKYEQLFFDNYAKMIYEDLDKNILEIIGSKTDTNTKNVLISASPNLYVKVLISMLGWEGSGSYFKENKFIHLHTEMKINWLENYYPAHELEYNFAISDNHSDDKLLSMFNEYLFVE